MTLYKGRQGVHRLRQCRKLNVDAVFSARTCERADRKLLEEEAPRELEAAIVATPAAAPVIPGTGGIRKPRRAGSGRGKQGGSQTVQFYRAGPEAVCLLLNPGVIRRSGAVLSRTVPVAKW